MLSGITRGSVFLPSERPPGQVPRSQMPSLLPPARLFFIFSKTSNPWLSERDNTAGIIAVGRVDPPTNRAARARSVLAASTFFVRYLFLLSSCRHGPCVACAAASSCPRRTRSGSGSFSAPRGSCGHETMLHTRHTQQ